MTQKPFKSRRGVTANSRLISFGLVLVSQCVRSEEVVIDAGATRSFTAAAGGNELLVEH